MSFFIGELKLTYSRATYEPVEGAVLLNDTVQLTRYQIGQNVTNANVHSPHVVIFWKRHVYAPRQRYD